MMRKVAGVVAAFTAVGMVGGCAGLDIAGLLNPKNIAAVQQILKEAGVSVSFKDPTTGQTVDIKSKEDVKSIKTKDGRELKEGDDYKFENGKLIFKDVQQKQTISIERPDGTKFSIDVEPDNKDQRARFIPDASGQFNEIRDDVDFDQEYNRQREQDKANRIKIKLPASFTFHAADVIGVAWKNCPTCPGQLLPDQAVGGLDGGAEFDVQALGPANPPAGQMLDDLKKRIWVIGWKTVAGKINVVRFKITKELKRAEFPVGQPGQIVKPEDFKLPGEQLIAATDIALEASATASYDTEEAAEAGENIKPPVFVGGQAPPPPPPQNN